MKPSLHPLTSALALILGLAVHAVADTETSTPPLVLTNRAGLALLGYDPVAYFTEHRPAKGNRRFLSTYHDIKYCFATAEHQRLFDRDPTRYIPAYGGYCGYAASVGKVRPADARLWSIVDGQLVLQHTAGAAKLWAKDVPGNKRKADAFWPRLIQAKAGVRNPVDSLLGKSVLPDAR